MVDFGISHRDGYSVELAKIADAEFLRCLEATQRSRRELVFGFISALKVLMIELPRGYTLSDAVVHVCAPDQQHRSRMRGVDFHYWSMPLSVVRVGSDRAGILVADPVTACLQMSAFCSREESTVLFDWLTRRSNSQKEENAQRLEELVETQRKFKGKEHARWACAHYKMNTDSSMESRFRLMLYENHLGEPMVNPLFVDPDTQRMWYMDLVLIEAGLVFEYQGKEWHSSEQSLENDSEKSLAMHKYGLMPIAVVSAFVFDPVKRKKFIESVKLIKKEREKTLTDEQKAIFVNLFRELR
ncbi:MAG: hypothetical protein LKI93_06455 [Bifidobacteriaceae bacterium]|jgi:hypothetical protein|nr:hypothetical protein [Bifidobacteriaceae bacterium]MCI1915366.1 hypothetical protein [Bifidobacteriaceae bacterium]